MSEGNVALASVCWVTSASAAAFLCFLQLGAMAAAGRAGLAFVAPIALMADIAGGTPLARREGLRGRMCWWPVGLTLILLAASLLLSAFFYDFSWDGQWYHQLGIIAIAREWNPLSDPMRSFAESPSRLHSQLYLWHYAKGPWYAAARSSPCGSSREMPTCSMRWCFRHCSNRLSDRHHSGTLR